jgi:hypothetical protein
VNSSLVRRCLQQLADAEINDLLASSPQLTGAVRNEAKIPKKLTVDAVRFRNWMRIPNKSDHLLHTLPTAYDGEMTKRRETGDELPVGAGPRAVMFLGETQEVTFEIFEAKLAALREEPVNAADQAVLDHTTADVGDDEPEAHIEQLRAQSVDLLEQLTAAAERVARGGRVELVDGAVASWNESLAVAWAQVGHEEVPGDASFGTLHEAAVALADQRRNDAARVAEQLGAQRLSKLERLRASARSMAALATDEPYKGMHEQILADIVAIESELGLVKEVRQNSSTDGADADEGSERDVLNETSLAESSVVDRAEKDGPVERAAVADESLDTDPVVLDSVVDGAGEMVVEETATGTALVLEPRTVVAAPAAEVDGESPRELDAQPVVRRESADSSGGPVLMPDDESGSETTFAGVDLAAVECGGSDSDGVEPELARQIATNGFGAAWLVASAAGLDAADVAAYRMAATAFASGAAGIDPSEVLVQLTKSSDGDTYTSPGSARVALAAALRSGLAAGWIPHAELESLVKQANIDTTVRHLVDVAVAACDRNYQHLQDCGAQRESADEGARDEAIALREQLSNHRISFTRANVVLRHLQRDDEALGEALTAIIDSVPGPGRKDLLVGLAAKLSEPDDLIDAADAKVSNAQQLREPIVSRARATLRKHIEAVAQCVRTALRAETLIDGDARDAVAEQVRHQLVDAAKPISASVGLVCPGDVALQRLVTWIITPEQPARFASETELLRDASLPLVTVPRREDGLPILGGVELDEVLAAFAEPRPLGNLFEAYADTGDLLNAAAVADRDPALAERMPEVEVTWRRRLANEVAATRAEIARTFADDLAQAAAVAAEAKLTVLQAYSGDRFDLEMSGLRQLQVSLAEHRERAGARLTTRVGAEIRNEVDMHRIEGLIAREDFIGATELLALARNGKALPGSDPDGGSWGAQLFDDYLSILAGLEQTKDIAIRQVVERLTAIDATNEVARGDLEQLDEWSHLAGLTQKTHKRVVNQAITLVLRTLGLDPHGEHDDITARGVRHYRVFRVNATPVDGSLVPGLGSRTKHYHVAVVSDPKQLVQALDSAFPAANGPNVVLFTGVLPLDERRKCLKLSRDKRISAIVVDYAVAAIVALRHPRSFKAVQQLTLPFTCFSHYAMVAGNVPDEVFVGRADELTTLEAQDGALFVFGGRQLGKSALLRKIERKFNSVPDQLAVFIDLSVHGIGTWSEPSRLWSVLFEELDKIGGVIPKNVNNVRNPEPVIRLIRDWLDGKESRRLLVLLDEADAFLDKESSVGGFENIGPLKRLFDSSAGRFKPVFAGLHKVQRLQNIANTPLAHGGGDVLIGPLDAVPARDLVVKPLVALGYRFANSESVWRLLAFTNLQAGLIQIVCTDLINHLQSRSLRKDEPLITIQESDIDAVTQSPQTRRKIAEKLRLTITLEDRYRVIALAVAIQSMEDGFALKYTAADIRSLCEIYWPDGFEELNSSDFAVYLEELVGLGVLISDADKRFAVRSPNIVTMLGTEEDLLAELTEDQRHFDVPHEYNPQSTRRFVEAYGVRSPLSERDLSVLMPVKRRYEARDFVIVGSVALSVDKVGRVLESVGQERNIDVTIRPVAGEDARRVLSEFKFAGGGNSVPRLLVLDASTLDSSGAAAAAEAILAMPARQHGHLAVIFGAQGFAAAKSIVNKGNRSAVELIRLAKWSGAGLRSWHDNPFASPAQRSDLLGSSGGWPELVERAISGVSKGGSQSEELTRLSNYPEDRDTATAFLDATGFDQGDCGSLAPWADLGPELFGSIFDIAAVLEMDPATLSAKVDDLELLGIVNRQKEGYAIDPVVCRALARCDESRS